MKAKLKTYVLMLAKQFPAHHYRKVEPTNFKEKLLSGDKIHTIRINAKLWASRIDEVNAGRAIISVREWSGKPYEKGSNQPELFQMHKCGYEFVDIGKETFAGPLIFGVYHKLKTDKRKIVQPKFIAANDGLEEKEFFEWFKKIMPKDGSSDRMIIIHFTDFRYTNSKHSFGAESYLIPTQN